MGHRQQLVPLGRRQLAALTRHRVLPALIVWLRQDRRDGEVAHVSRQDRAAGRVKREQHWGR